MATVAATARPMLASRKRPRLKGAGREARRQQDDERESLVKVLQEHRRRRRPANPEEQGDAEQEGRLAPQARVGVGLAGAAGAPGGAGGGEGRGDQHGVGPAAGHLLAHHRQLRADHPQWGQPVRVARQVIGDGERPVANVAEEELTGRHREQEEGGRHRHRDAPDDSGRRGGPAAGRPWLQRVGQHRQSGGRRAEGEPRPDRAAHAHAGRHEPADAERGCSDRRRGDRRPPCAAAAGESGEGHQERKVVIPRFPGRIAEGAVEDEQRDRGRRHCKAGIRGAAGEEVAGEEEHKKRGRSRTGKREHPGGHQQMVTEAEEQPVDEHEIGRVRVRVVAIRKHSVSCQQCPAGDELVLIPHEGRADGD